MDQEFLPLSQHDCHTAWEELMEEAKLSREAREVLCEALRKHKILTTMGGHEKQRQDHMYRNAALFFLLSLLVFCFYHYCCLVNMSIIVLTCMFWMYRYHTSPSSEHTVLREKVLKVFPEVSVKLAKRITHLRELADRADEVHKTCTKDNMAACYSGMGSSVMSIVGLALVPVSGSLSMGISGFALGMLAVASATGLTTGIMKQRSMLSIEAKFKDMKLTGVSPRAVATGDLQHNSFRLSSSFNIFTNLQQVWRHSFATKSSSPPPSTWVQRLLGWSAMTMTKRDIIESWSTTNHFTQKHAYSLMHRSNHLDQGAKSEVAETLRQRARMLERMEEVVTQIHETLLNRSTFPQSTHRAQCGGQMSPLNPVEVETAIENW